MVMETETVDAVVVMDALVVVVSLETTVVAFFLVYVVDVELVTVQ
jgi:hypothetical protein